MDSAASLRRTSRALAALSLAAALAAAPALARAAPRRTVAKGAQITAALRTSPALWATIDVCNPPDQRYTVGIRGSMPSNGQAHDSMFMRFRLQQQDAMQHWFDLPGAASAFVRVGSSREARESGLSFTLYPGPKGTAFVLRGVVTFEWRRGSRVLGTISRASRAGHQSQTGADPAKFSAAICRIG